MVVARLFAASLCLGLAAPLLAQEPPPALPRLALAEQGTSVIGVSSGGYMAAQLAVAWPTRFDGLGVIAAGPWACAQGELGRALGQCMYTRLGLPDLAALEARHQSYLERDQVGAPADLAELRAFVWHGGHDATVDPALGEALAEQLSGWLEAPARQLRLLETDAAGHGWPVAADSGVPAALLSDCADGGGHHLLACDLDIAGEALGWLHDGLTPPDRDAAPAGALRHFDQTAFEAKGLADLGYLYVPSGCEAGGCTLTVALHGCEMSAAEGDEAFVRYSGLNAWAAANRRVVLYPQAEATLANPKGCWDWWGFAESAWQLDPLHDSRQGQQVTALMDMVDRLQARSDAD